MSLAAPQPATDPAESLARIIEGLCEAIAARCEQERLASPLKRLARMPLRRLAAWLAALMAEFRAGLLAPEPAAHHRSPVAPALSRAPAPPPRRLRRGLGWLAWLMPVQATAAVGGQAPDRLSDRKIGRAARGLAASPPPSQPALPDAGDPAVPALCSPRRGPSASRPNEAAAVPAAALLAARSPLPIPAGSPLFPRQRRFRRTAADTAPQPPRSACLTRREAELTPGLARPFFTQGPERRVKARP